MKKCHELMIEVLDKLYISECIFNTTHSLLLKINVKWIRITDLYRILHNKYSKPKKVTDKF